MGFRKKESVEHSRLLSMVNRRRSRHLLSSSRVEQGEVLEVPFDVVLLSGRSSTSWQRLDEVKLQVSATRNDYTEALGNLLDTAFLEKLEKRY
jgi:hypothetical protein